MVVALAGLVGVGVAAPVGLRFGAALALSAAMLAALAFGLVGIRRQPPLLRLVAGTGLMFVTLMTFLSFADLLTRPG